MHSTIPTQVAAVIAVTTPYFQARFAEAARFLRPAKLHAVELGRYSDTYAFSPTTGGGGAVRHILGDTPLERQQRHDVVSSVAAVLEQIRPDVVAVPGWSGVDALAALAWCISKSVPAVVMSESTAWDEKRVFWKEWIKRQVVGSFSAALVGGRPHADYMMSLGLARDRVFLGYDAVDNEYFAQGASEARSSELEVGKKHGLPLKYFLASNRFIEKKNLARLIEAYARYRELLSNSNLKSKNTSPWELVLLGDGSLRESLNSQLSTINLHDHVQMPGFKQYPELPAYYGLASAFIHASTTEQWGLVVNEAMASGLPVLVSNRCGCASDLVQEGVNGFTFDPYNVAEMANAMVQISTFRDDKLAAFGAESARLISSWGPDRFAGGLKQAVECALRIGPIKPTLLQRLILRALLLR